jgi:glycerophosphoryl diester phosphodiesterase
MRMERMKRVMTRRSAGRPTLALSAAVSVAAIGCTMPVDQDGVPGWPDDAFARSAGAPKVSYRDTPRPWVIGHRGLGKDEFENLLPSLVAAIEKEGAVGIEVDVALTRDGQAVAMHDSRLDRTTQCTGCVAEHTLAEIQSCAASDAGGSIYPPSLAEVLAALRGLPVEPLIMIDTKFGPGDGCPIVAPNEASMLGERIVDEIERAGTSRFTGVQGTTDLLLAVRRRDPDVLTLYQGPIGEATAAASEHGFSGIAVSLKYLDRASLAGARARGLLIDTYVVNAPIDVATAVSYDVDVLETDRVRAVLESFQ